MMHGAVIACPAIVGVLGLLDLLYPWKASWPERDRRHIVLGCWLVVYCTALGITSGFWRRESSHFAFQLMLEFSWLYALGIQVCTLTLDT
jgi:fatty-acid desaturase